MGKIDDLERLLWEACVIQKPATSQEQLGKWQTDELLHLQERFAVTPIPAGLRPLLANALEAWGKIEEAILRRTETDRGAFLQAFDKVRQAHQNGNRIPMQLLPFCTCVEGAVRNMDWATLFAMVLPAADPENRLEHLERGRVVVAALYSELIGKAFLSRSDQHQEALRKIDARWRLLSSG